MKRFQAVTAAVMAGGLMAVAAACGSSGSTGATGPTGPTGPQGPQGTPGNANVLVDTFTVTNSQWLWNSQYAFQTNPTSYTEYFTRYHDVADSAVTQGVLNTGMVLVYFTPNTSNNTDQWSPLPYEFSDGSGNFNYEFVFETMVDTVRLHFFFVQTNPSATIPVLSSYTIATYKFKIVAVSGSIAEGMVAAHVNLKDYGDVKRYLKL